MPDKKSNAIRRETLIEKIIRRILETIGGSVDRLFGRGRKLNALPNTGDVGERLRRIIDESAQVNKDGRKLAPHLIRLKYAWGQTSDELLAALKKLENELLIVAIDHINDHRYATLAPIKFTSKADILTEGFTLSVGFDEADHQNDKAIDIPIEIYAKLLPQIPQSLPVQRREIAINVIATFPNGRERQSILPASLDSKENFIVGRIKECDLYLDDPSVSKHHASLVFNLDGALKVADVGSTNGTFLNGERIAYGKAYQINPTEVVGFGEVKVSFNWELPTLAAPQEIEAAAADNVEDKAEIGVNSVDKSNLDDFADNLRTTIGTQNNGADGYKTFVDAGLKDSQKTFVDVELRDKYKTFVDAELNDEFATRISSRSQSNPVNESEKPFDSTTTFVSRQTTKLKTSDFTQSLAGKLIESSDQPENVTPKDITKETSSANENQTKE